MNVQEIWKAVPDYDGVYEASNLGSVRSVPRRDKNGRCRKGCSRRLRTGTSGYRIVNLLHDGQRKTMLVHRLVAACFCHRPDGCTEVNHINADKCDNAASNLEWCQHKQNVRHTIKLGRHSYGSKHGMAKLNAEQVARIRDEYTGRRGQMTELAKAFQVSRSMVNSIILNRNWKRVA